MPRIIIIGDIHGCADELRLLLKKIEPTKNDTIISLGDVTDKGPDSRAVLNILAAHGAAIVIGNHDDRYIKYWRQGLSADAVNAKNIKDKYKLEYAKLADTAELDWLGKNATLYTEVTVKGQLFTFVHAGIVPYINIYDAKEHHIGEALRVRYLDADSHRFVRLVQVDNKFPDESTSWQPEHDNIVEWQRIYDGRYGIVVHGHIIVGPNPILWLTNINGETKKVEIDGQTTTKNACIQPHLYQMAQVKAISLDTGAHKGWNLTAMIIEENSGDIYFEQVEVSTCYEP